MVFEKKDNKSNLKRSSIYGARHFSNVQMELKMSNGSVEINQSKNKTPMNCSTKAYKLIISANS